MSSYLPEVAHQIALFPLLWVSFLRLRGKPLDVAWLWLAGAFFVSWLADTAAHWMNPWTTSKLYPVTQTAIIGLVFLSRREALILVGVLGLAGAVDLLWIGVGDFDILLRTVAWLAIVGIVYPLRQLGRLRMSLLVAFGLGWVCWMWYAINPGWWSWSVYQLTRLAGILLFCWAATNPMPRLRVLQPSL